MMDNWKTFAGQDISVPIEVAVEQAIVQEQTDGHKLKVCIGSDSQVYGDRVEFATVIVFLRARRGGFMYIAKERVTQAGMSLKERMISEVSKSVQIAYHLCEVLDRYDVDLEVHADINTDSNYKSHVALKEAMGYITGMGFTFKAKPDAFASSYVADKLV